MFFRGYEHKGRYQHFGGICCLILQERLAGFKGKREGRTLRGLHKTEMESTYFIETFASVKSRKFSLYFLATIRNKIREKLVPTFIVTDSIVHILNATLLPPFNCKSGPADEIPNNQYAVVITWLMN
jgi:hypothetical protein